MMYTCIILLYSVIASSITVHLLRSIALLHIQPQSPQHSVPVLSPVLRERQGDRRHSTMLFAFPSPALTVNIVNLISHAESRTRPRLRKPRAFLDFF